MKSVVDIKRIVEVKELQLIIEPNEKDSFIGTLAQSGKLPSVFLYGSRRIIKHVCAHCALEVEAQLSYGSKNLIGLGMLSRQDFSENRGQLDIVGQLFDQYLFHEVDENGFESYLYQSAPGASKGALLRVAYYWCAHCQAQYLMLYQNQPKEHIPPFEPDEILIVKIYQVAFDHDELLRVLNKIAKPLVM